MKKTLLIESIQKAQNYVTHYVESELKKHKIKNIKYSHYEIIRLLHIESKMTMKELSKHILKHKSTVTALVNKLVHENFIDTHSSKKDKRVTFVNLNEKGKKLRGLINTIEQKLLIHIHQQLSKQEQVILSSKLNTLFSAK